ncbi:serine/threonine protein phosphatase [Candidatus Pacearchaeota archaeon]|nr:serine/threonine protein phosphatase [Candidatus Pacearchaeota archaeon]
MSTNSNLNTSNKLRDILYNLGQKQYPEYVFQWYFKFFAGGPVEITNPPYYLIENFEALLTTAQIMLDHKYNQGKYSTIIKDTRTPHYNYYYVGDTHGSLIDTYTIIDYLVRVFQVHPYTKVVFLGDIVDRNPYDLENLAFILSFWLLFPDNVYILRGNHEDSSVCSRYGFSQHLYDRIGNRQRFELIWNKVIKFFTRLPLGIRSTIGEKEIIALHGGIPFNIDDYNVPYEPIDLNKFESNLDCFHPEHYDMDPYSRAILWSDPDAAGSIDQMVAPTPRTGRPRFSQQAFQQFLDVNNLDGLVRGHQKFESGYNLLWGNKLVSLFSTSTYDSRPIGHAKFLRLTPKMKLSEIGDEELGYGEGILPVEPVFLERRLQQKYRAETTQ